ncbi:MAG: TetR/AcrR family transcriptional regulator [Alistipes sp.]|nr:TetR/AcrR family transcriptional regulator [Alistipes sp.]
MKRGATRQEVIRTTQELIARNGIRAVRVDEIVAMLGISKRTLYEMFADKNDLVAACLEEMGHMQRRRIADCHCGETVHPLSQLRWLIDEYVDSLYVVERSFLADLCRKETFAEQFAEHREFWMQELCALFRTCCEEQLILPEIEASVFVRRVMETLLELRLAGTPREELYLFSRTILRGAASRQGVEFIDGR